MADQDNETYKDRVRDAVIDAVTSAGQAYPGADIVIDLPAAQHAICDALATFTLFTAGMAQDSDGAAAAIDEARARLNSLLQEMADGVRAGTFTVPKYGRPKPRLVT